MADKIFDPMSMETPQPEKLVAQTTPATGLAKAMWDSITDPTSPGPKATLVRLRRDAERAELQRLSDEALRASSK